MGAYLDLISWLIGRYFGHMVCDIKTLCVQRLGLVCR